MSASSPSKPCPDCGGAKDARLILCHACWKELPGKLSGAFNKARSTEDRRAAAREILDHLIEKRRQPQLPFSI